MAPRGAHTPAMVPIHLKDLRDLYGLQDSLAYRLPLLELPASNILHLEVWRKNGEVGSRIAIPVSMLLQVSKKLLF